MSDQTQEALNESVRLMAQSDERKLGEGLTSLEFESDMMSLLKRDPIAMLGYKASMPNRRSPSIRKLPDKQSPLYYDVSEDPIGPNYNSRIDKVGYGRDYGSSKDIILHELRHRGLKILEERYKEKDSFISDYGDMAYQLLDKADISGSKSNEFVVELYDNPDATYIKPGDNGSKNTIGYVSDSLQFVDPNSDTQAMPDVADELLGIALSSEDHSQYRSLVDNTSISKEQIAEGKVGLDRAARDLLNEIGVLGIGTEPNQKFNEGGAVMSKSDMQMEMLLQEGGIADDGTTVDPVSGNEVPPGSMAEEVRDDVPAQLSEGEYVVPADVTRYYGVKFFEDLRTEAKRGMGQMEADGRIGGEPVSQTMDNQAGGALTPEELAMLQEMGMAVGGMVPPPEAVGNTGEYNKGGQVLYAQDGVDVTAANASTPAIDPYQAQFTQGMGSAFAPGYLTQQTIAAAQQPKTTIVMLYSPDGIAVSVTLPAEQAKYDQLVADGYTTTPVATTTETTVSTGNDDPPPPETAKPVNYTGMSEAELQKAYSQNQTAMAMMAGMAAINPIFGAFGAWATNSTKKKIEAEMKRQNFAVPEGGGIFDLSLGGIVDGIKDLLGLSDEETAKVVSKVGGSQEPSSAASQYSEPTQDQKAAFDTANEQATTIAAQYADDGDSSQSAIDKHKEIFDKAVEGGASAGVAGSAAAQAVTSGLSDTALQGGKELDIAYGISGLNAGGFVSKRSKKKKK